MLSEESKVVELRYEWPYTALKELKNCLKLLMLANCCTSSTLLFHQLSCIFWSLLWPLLFRYLNWSFFD